MAGVEKRRNEKERLKSRSQPSVGKGCYASCQGDQTTYFGLQHCAPAYCADVKIHTTARVAFQQNTLIPSPPTPCHTHYAHRRKSISTPKITIVLIVRVCMVNVGLYPVCWGPDAENNSTHPRGQGPLLETARTRSTEVLDNFAATNYLGGSLVKNNAQGKGSVTPMNSRPQVELNSTKYFPALRSL